MAKSPNGNPKPAPSASRSAHSGQFLAAKPVTKPANITLTQARKAVRTYYDQMSKK